MIVVYMDHPKKGKARKVFWNDQEALAYCAELIKQGYVRTEG